MKVRLKPNIDIDKYPILDCQDKSRNLYLNFDTIDEIAEITITKLEKEKYKFKYHIIIKENEYGYYFNIVDNKIDDDWSVVEDDTTITMAPKSINYPEFWENYENGFIEEEKRYCVRFGHIVQKKFSTKWHRRIFQDYQDSNIAFIGQDAGFDGYVIYPHCFNTEQINPKIGVIK